MALAGKHSFSRTAPSVPSLLPSLAGLSRGEQSRCAPGIVKLVTAGGNTTGNCQAQPRAGSRGWHLQSPHRASAKTAPRACQGLHLSGRSAGSSNFPLLPPGMLNLLQGLWRLPSPKGAGEWLINTFQINIYHGYPSFGKTDRNSPALCLSHQPLCRASCQLLSRWDCCCSGICCADCIRQNAPSISNYYSPLITYQECQLV